MTIKTEGPHRGGFLVSEAEGTRSREEITVLSGENLVAGAVLGQITVGGKFVAHDPLGSDGSEDAAGILYGPVDATDGDTKGVAIVRDAEVNEGEIVFEDDVDTDGRDAAIADLLALGIVMR